MKKYKFLIKPLFYIFSLLFSSWMVFRIEEMNSPEKNSPAGVQLKRESGNDNIFLKKMISEYKNGTIDSVTMERRLEDFLSSSEEALLSKSKKY